MGKEQGIITPAINSNFDRHLLTAPKKRLVATVGGQTSEAGFSVRTRVTSIFDNLAQGSETTGHEIDHVLGAESPEEVDHVTNISGPGYYGKTVFKSPNRVAAAAAHANGRHGTGWDMMIVRMSGDESSAISAAKTRLSSNARYRPILESDLERKRFLTGGDIKERMMQVDKEYQLGPEVEVEITLPNGKTEKRTERVKGRLLEIDVVDSHDVQNAEPALAV